MSILLKKSSHQFWRFNKKEKVIVAAICDPVAEPERYLDFLQYLKEVSDQKYQVEIYMIKFSTMEDFLEIE